MPKTAKKILFLTIDFPPMGGGMARHSLDVARALKEIGFEISVTAPSAQPGAGYGTDTELYVHRLKSVRADHIFDNYLKSVMAFFFHGMRYVLTNKVELAIANTWSIAGLAAFFIKKITGVPYIVFAHGLDIYAPQTSPKARKLMDAVLENASFVVANSNFTGRLVREVTNRPRVIVLNPIIDPARLVSGISTGGRDEGGKGQELLTVARVVESKGHDLVIRSLPKVLAKFPNTMYRIVGSGPQETVLSKLAAELGISGHVIFAGEVDEETLIAYYRNCDVFIMMSRQICQRGEVEGFGIVFIEAGFFAKPVIASRSGGISDAVVDGITGLIADPAEPETVADAIISLFSDKEFARQLGEAGNARANKEFSPGIFSEKLKDVINMVPYR